MAHIKRKYIDSHWLIFFLKGILALLFGWIALFGAGSGDTASLVSVIGVFLLSLSIIEFANSLHRAHMRTGWGVSVVIAILDMLVAMLLLLTISQNSAWHLVLIAIYTVARGACEIVTAFRGAIDPSDRFIWLLSGICGCVMGFVILNTGAGFIRFFGAYLLVLGICNLIYGNDNRVQKLEDHEARVESAKVAKTAKKPRSSKKR